MIGGGTSGGLEVIKVVEELKGFFLLGLCFGCHVVRCSKYNLTSAYAWGINRSRVTQLSNLYLAVVPLDSNMVRKKKAREEEVYHVGKTFACI